MQCFCNTREIKMIYRVFIRSKLVKNPLVIYYIAKYYSSMNHRNISLAMSILLKIQKHAVSPFLFANHAYFLGQYQVAIQHVKTMLQSYPKHSESSYLLSQCLVKEGRVDDALSLLYQTLSYSNRKKTWLYLSNTISNYQQFLEFDRAFNLLPASKLKDKNLLSYYSDAAVKVGAPEYAIRQWNAGIDFIRTNKITQKKVKGFFSTQGASESLLHFKSILDQEGIPFFLVSGTLLGCVRDRQILSHDKDLDVGIWNEDISLEQLVKIFQLSGCFEIMPIKIHTLLKLKHINGSFIDVFIHYKSGYQNWHATSKLKWTNTNFQLIDQEFLGQKFKIPKDYNLYLNENYGEDWRYPKPNFDSTFDTPNANVVSKDELIVYLHRKIFESFLFQTKNHDYLLSKLREIKD